jgi:hypothetical protein
MESKHEEFWDGTDWGVIEVMTPSGEEKIGSFTIEELYAAFKERLLREIHAND